MHDTLLSHCCPTPPLDTAAAAAMRPAHAAAEAPLQLPLVLHLQAAEQLGLPRMVSIQNSYSLVVRGGFETDLAEVCAARQANLGLLAYSPLAGGALTGKYIAGGAGVEKARLNLFQGEEQGDGCWWGRVWVRRAWECGCGLGRGFVMFSS